MHRQAVAAVFTVPAVSVVMQKSRRHLQGSKGFGMLSAYAAPRYCSRHKFCAQSAPMLESAVTILPVVMQKKRRQLRAAGGF